MAISTWTWFGGTAFSTIAADWTLTPGGSNGVPQPGDTVLIPGGIVQDGLGELAGQGNVTIQAGGTVSVTSASDGISLGQTAATAGTMTVTGTAAELTVASGTNVVVVGGAGTGGLFVQNGGSVFAGTQVGAGAPTGISITGTGVIITQAPLVFGIAIDIGQSATGTGAVSVSGLKSLINAAGQIDVGASGNGSLTIQNQGTVISGGATLAPSEGVDVGEFFGGSGTISVSGTNSLLLNTGAFIVGDVGNGSVSIASAGTVITGPGTVGGLAGLVIGSKSSSSSSGVTIAGAGSQLQVTGLLQVGAAGTGSLQLSGGAAVSAGSLDEGVASTGVGNISLTGTGTNLTLSGTANVADASVNAILSILGGATFSAASLNIGAGGGGSGNVTLLDPGSVINVTGALNIGTVGAVAGTGVLTIGSGAAVHAPLVNLQSGAVVLEGGLLDPTVTTLLGITTSGYGTVGANFVVDEGTILSNGSGLNKTNLEVLGTVLGGGTLTISGSSTLAGTTKHTPGILQIGIGDTLEMNGAVLNAAATTFTDTQGGTYLVNNSVVDVVFQDNTGVLTLDDIAGFGGTIATYHPGDALVITGGTLSNLGVKNGNTLTVSDTGAGAGTGNVDQIIFSAGIDPTTLTIKNGNTIVASNSAIANGTTLEIAAGPFGLTNFNAAGSPQYTTLQIDPGVSAIADASDLLAGVTLTDLGQISLGSGTMTGGIVTVGGTTGSTASGTVTTGGVWSGISQLVVGGAGAGSFLVNNAGTAASAIVDLAASAGGSGAITVTGTKSLLSSTGTFIVGDKGLGSLSIQAGGTVTTTAGATIANTASASGSSVNVTGAGSNLRVGGSLVVGATATGSLGVAAGASVTAGSLDAGGQAGSAGIVTLSGNASTLTTTGTIGVGDSGIGEFQVLNGATLNVGGDFNVGQLTGGSGVADFENPGGTVILGGNLNIGLGGGPAEVIIGLNSPVQFDNGGENVGANGKLIQYTAFDPLFANNTGVIDLAAGTTPYLAYFNNAGGTLGQASGVSSILQSPTIYGAGGLIQVGAGSSLVLDVGAVSNQSIGFASNAGTLEIGIDNLTTIDVPQSGTTGFTKEANPNLGQALIGGFAGTINASFAATNTIVVDTTAAATFAVNGSVVTVSTGGSLAFASAALAQTAFNTAGALVDQVTCYAAGTRIETVDGPVAVEKLRVGDEVRTLLGGPGRIVWVGSREVNGAAHPRPKAVWPVRIARDAFGAGLPQRDLFVSPDHAIYLDGVLVPAKLLVNGTTVRQVKRRLVTYHHIELERHDVVLAEGLPAETYLDAGDRANFAGETTVRLYPDFAALLAPDAALVWETKGAAPLVMAGDALDRARRAVAGTASPRARNEAGAGRERSVT